MINQEIKKELIKKFIEESDVCMAEFLASENVPNGMSFEDAFEMYIALMKEVEGDKFFVIKDEKIVSIND